MNSKGAVERIEEGRLWLSLMLGSSLFLDCLTVDYTHIGIADDIASKAEPLTRGRETKSHFGGKFNTKDWLRQSPGLFVPRVQRECSRY